MQTQTRRQPHARPSAVITPPAPALIAVPQPPRRAVIPRADDAASPDQHAADAPLHAVAALGGERGEPHEVRVPAGPQAGLVREVERAQGGVEGGEGGGAVEEAELGAVEERGEAGVRRVEVGVVAADEVG